MPTKEQMKELYELVIMQYKHSGTGQYEVAQGSGGCLHAALVLTGGVATADATGETLVDDTKNFEEDIYIGKTAIITVDGVDYHRVLLSSIGDTIGFAPLAIAVPAAAVVGTGDDEGQAVVICKGALVGIVGNGYSLQIVQGEELTDDDVAALDEETKMLTITVNLGTGGGARTLSGAALATLLDETPETTELFEVGDAPIPGDLPIGGDPMPFGGGRDEVVTPKGAPYEIRA